MGRLGGQLASPVGWFRLLSIWLLIVLDILDIRANMLLDANVGSVPRQAAVRFARVLLAALDLCPLAIVRLVRPLGRSCWA